MTDWQDIATAPGNASRIMLGRRNPVGWVALGYRSIGTGRWLDDHGREFQQQPTHWQAMPEVPK